MTYTFTETNDGDGPLQPHAAADPLRSSDVSRGQTFKVEGIHNIGDGDNDGVRRTRRGPEGTVVVHPLVSNTTVMVIDTDGHRVRGKDITWCADTS